MARRSNLASRINQLACFRRKIADRDKENGGQRPKDPLNSSVIKKRLEIIERRISAAENAHNKKASDKPTLLNSPIRDHQ